MIGNTPTVRITVPSLEPDMFVYGKIESKNPFGSIKDRASYYMLKGAVEKGQVKRGGAVVTATSGNTGIALAAIAPLLGLKCIVVMPETMSEERKRIIRGFGAKLVLTEGAKGMKGALDEADLIVKENPGTFLIDQFANPDNPRAHYETTGPEIIKDVPDVSFVVSAIGSGGTISGLGRYFKENGMDVKMIGVEPEESPLITKGYAKPHGIQGIGANFIPGTLDLSLLSTVRTVSTKSAIDHARLLMKNGIFAGISSGAAVEVAIDIARENRGRKVLAILPDTAERYLSGPLFE